MSPARRYMLVLHILVVAGAGWLALWLVGRIAAG